MNRRDVTDCFNTVLNPHSYEWYNSLQLYSSGREPWLLNFKGVITNHRVLLNFPAIRRSILEEIKRRKRNVVFMEVDPSVDKEQEKERG